MNWEHESPQDGCPAGMEIDVTLRARRIILRAVNEAMEPALDSLGTGGCNELVSALEKEIVRSASFYAISLADALKKVHALD